MKDKSLLSHLSYTYNDIILTEYYKRNYRWKYLSEENKQKIVLSKDI